MKIGIYTNILKDKDLLVTKSLINELEKKNVHYFIDAALSSISQNLLTTSELILKSDYIIVIGGDGTILNIITECALNNVPVLGINTGTIGFLTEAEISDISFLVQALSKKEFSIENRCLLKADFNGKTGYALNEVLISRSGDFRVINIDLLISDNIVDSYAADGFIVSSPTGSTAYSLSCGGPILSPFVNALVLTPINPHSLHSRAIVVNDSEIVKIRVKNARAGAGIVIDGKLIDSLDNNEEVTVYKSDIFASFIRLKEKNFYSRLFSKLSIWSTRN